MENSKTSELCKAGKKADRSGQRGKPPLGETSRRLLPWVQAQGTPELSQMCDEVVVHLQSFYRCAPAGCQPDEAHSVCTPGKVSSPLLSARMKCPHRPSRLGITGIDTPPLIAVTGTATQTDIGELSLITGCSWNDVIDLQRHAEQLLRAMAVGTARLWKPCPQCATQRERDATHPLFPFTMRPFVRWSRRNRAL